MNFIQKIWAIGVILLMNSFILADEGMWTPDNLPLEKIKLAYKFTPSQNLLRKIQLASVRFNDGGSGSFVSQGGLLLTNHHVALGQLQKLSTPKRDIVQNGYYAKALKEELPCPDLEINILVKTQDVTKKVQAAISGLTDLGEIKRAREKAISQMEKKEFEKTGLRADVVTLYHGGEYWLYTYKKLTDIRLVFAPEYALAAFGGDPDNFQFPRYVLDFTFFRAYENGKPYTPEAFLVWNSQGLKDGELSFVSGHPGSTDRHKTLSQLRTYKETSFPETLKIIRTKLKALREYSLKGKEQERRAKNSILGMENGLKAIEGEYIGLQDPKIFQIMEEKETELKKLCKEDPKLFQEYGETWTKIEKIQEEYKSKRKQITYRRLGGKLSGYALGIVRYGIEMKKSNEERYKEFRDSSLDSWKHSFLSKAPIYLDLEELHLTLQLEMAVQELGSEDEFVQKALGNKAPKEVAKHLIKNTQLSDPNFRKKILESGLDFINSSKDPLIVWVRNIEPIFRQERDWYENQMETPLKIESGKISRLKFALYGKSQYPDATFTLRLSYGTQMGYEVDGWKIPATTSYYGLLERSKAFAFQEPFSITPSLEKSLKKLNYSARLNFVTTHDITGGNSGSPVINKKGELVGLIFDGNSYSHVLNYLYTSEKARAISVATEGMEEALRTIYSAKRVLKELKIGD
jgi:hypothetical protein